MVNLSGASPAFIGDNQGKFSHRQFRVASGQMGEKFSNIGEDGFASTIRGFE